jgi:hypothetical protein
MLVNESARFIFRGNAMPFGGRITKRNDTQYLATIPGPPAAALAVVGGFSHATSGAAKPHEAFSWGGTVAEAKGELLTNGHYQTTVTSSISTVWAKNDPHVFEADILRVTLISDHANLRPASIKITDVAFGGTVGMRLDGERIEVEYNDDLTKNPTLDEFQDRYQSNKDFFGRHPSPLKPGVAFGDPPPRTRSGYVLTSIVHAVKWKGKTFAGNSLRVSGFGTLYFGEVLMNEDNRRLTMVRLQMGSAVGAEVAFAEADPNGTWGAA